MEGVKNLFPEPVGLFLPCLREGDQERDDMLGIIYLLCNLGLARLKTISSNI